MLQNFIEKVVGRKNKIGIKDHSRIMGLLDNWVAQHPWARAGWVPEDKITTDYVRVFPNAPVCDPTQTFPIQQVRAEISELIMAILKLEKKDKIFEIGMGFAGGTHYLWSQIFSKVISVEYDPDRVDKFINSQNLDGQRSTILVGDSTRPYTIHTARQLANGCDALFIDGDHSRKAVELDWRNYIDTVRPGGIVIFHDTKADAPPDTEVYGFVKALESGEITGSPIKMHHIHHSMCVGISYYFKEIPKQKREEKVFNSFV